MSSMFILTWHTNRFIRLSDVSVTLVDRTGWQTSLRNLINWHYTFDFRSRISILRILLNNVINVHFDMFEKLDKPKDVFGQLPRRTPPDALFFLKNLETQTPTGYFTNPVTETFMRCPLSIYEKHLTTLLFAIIFACWTEHWKTNRFIRLSDVFVTLVDRTG